MKVKAWDNYIDYKKYKKYKNNNYKSKMGTNLLWFSLIVFILYLISKLI